MASYFLKNSEEGEKAPVNVTPVKMADNHSDMEGINDMVTWANLQQLEAALVKKLTSRLAELLMQAMLTSIEEAVAKSKKTADCALDLAMAIQEGECSLQYEQEGLCNRILTLESAARMFNIKIRGIPENAEDKIDL